MLRHFVVFIFLSASFQLLFGQLNVEKPNIILINCDDMGYGDIGSYALIKHQTPALDKLAKGGQRWTQFYAPASVCTPSRAGLLTGKLPIRTGMYGKRNGVLFPFSLGGLPQKEQTLAKLLKGAGYSTAMVGKWHLGHLPEFLPTSHGFDSYYGIPYSNDMQRVPKRWKNWQVYVQDYQQGINGFLDYKNYNVPLMRNEKRIEQPVDQNTLTKRYTEEAIAIIERTDSQPFFLYLAHSMPHIPLFRSERFAGKSRGGIYGDVIEEIDWSVGQLLKALKRVNKLKNTLIIFTSDNGPWLMFDTHGGATAGLRGSKATAFEGGYRVPTIFYWKGKIKPATIDQLGSGLDIYATISSIIGAGKRTIDGYDLSPTLFFQQSSKRDKVYYYLKNELIAIRKGDFKLHLKQIEISNSGMQIIDKNAALFDLREDPYEKLNVVTKYPKIKKRLIKEIKQHLDNTQVTMSQLDLN